MTDERFDDRVLLAVRAARPASPAASDSPSSREAELVLERVMSSRPREKPRRMRSRVIGWAVSVLGALTTTAVIVVSLGVLGRNHHPQGAPTRSGPGHTLSASDYVFAVGGDSSANTSRAQISSGVLLFRADQVLRERCMRQRGFRYTPAHAPNTSSLPSVTGYPSTFYAQPLASAYPQAALLALREREGFGIHAGSLAHHGDPDPNDKYLKTLTPARQKAWRDAWIGRNGCYGTAQVQLFGSHRAVNLEQEVPNQIYNNLNAVAYDRDGKISRSHPRIAQAATAWSRCMRASTGHAWSDENDLVTGLDAEYTSSQQRTESFAQVEIKAAAADTKCAYSTGQAEVFAAAFRQAANHLPAKLDADLQFLLSHRPAWIRRASKIVNSPNG